MRPFSEIFEISPDIASRGSVSAGASAFCQGHSRYDDGGGACRGRGVGFHSVPQGCPCEGREDWRGYGMTDSIYLSYSFAVTVWLSADCCQIGIIPEKEEILTVILAVFRNLCIFAVPNEYGAHSSVG